MTHLSFNDYQDHAHRTAIYPPEQALEYLSLGLTSEAGEVAGKVKKIIRDHNGACTAEAAEAIADELGDVLWYVAELAAALGYTLEEVAQRNASKLLARQERGKLQGSGDNR